MAVASTDAFAAVPLAQLLGISYGENETNHVAVAETGGVDVEDDAEDAAVAVDHSSFGVKEFGSVGV